MSRALRSHRRAFDTMIVLRPHTVLGSQVMLRERIDASLLSRTVLLRLRLSLRLCVCVALRKSALTQALQPVSTPAPAECATDPLGRNTPSNSVLGFLKAAQDGDYSIAAQYLQMSAARRQTEGEQIATKLKFVLDHAFSGKSEPIQPA